MRWVWRLPPAAADETEHAERALVPQPCAEVRVARDKVVRSVRARIRQLDVSSIGESELPAADAVGEVKRGVREERFVLQQWRQCCNYKSLDLVATRQ